ncbi:hypothetical protein [Pelagibacterium sp.]|uniref:hypothetical protein n=1 Tax=Pelagibacterium sp. TaxID=1967288 RepID=UPI003BACC983
MATLENGPALECFQDKWMPLNPAWKRDKKKTWTIFAIPGRAKIHLATGGHETEPIQ